MCGFTIKTVHTIGDVFADKDINGEDLNGIPNNLMLYIAQVDLGKLPYLNLHDNDYDTPDGKGMHDYIHVMELAKGHLVALSFIERQSGLHIFNIGTGKGSSVLEMVKTFKGESGNLFP